MEKGLVIKGLECCGQVAYKCKECPYQHFGSEDCVGELTKDALSVIRKQDDEIYFGGNYESGYKRGRADERAAQNPVNEIL